MKMVIQKEAIRSPDFKYKSKPNYRMGLVLVAYVGGWIMVAITLARILGKLK